MSFVFNRVFFLRFLENCEVFVTEKSVVVDDDFGFGPLQNLCCVSVVVAEQSRNSWD